MMCVLNFVAMLRSRRGRLEKKKAHIMKLKWELHQLSSSPLLLTHLAVCTYGTGQGWKVKKNRKTILEPLVNCLKHCEKKDQRA